ncbi:hypothetical protein ACERK3_15275 [Phycisphaerales bacterium AB-hyl4]|uniref:Terminase large subunit gp17-like C-terminal domain-containing protein n=1 Tax=Natronomicrosphaera hydrolytica TaxID=3242702 RepID=A0ABV4UAN8_9BACT
MVAKLNREVRTLLALRPSTPGQLHRFVHRVLGLNVPREAMSAGHAPPFAYLCDAFFEAGEPGLDRVAPESTTFGDCVVWANRGGGKTMLGAAATLLDMVFKPGVQVRILGGSLEQSSKMFEHLVTLFDRPGLRGVLAGVPTQRRVATVHGSVVQVLAQSQRSVRGVRVHKLRCDEVEEFDPEVWQAAQLVTRSGWCGEGAHRVWVNGRVEALSTMHRPFGMMSRLTRGADDASTPDTVFRWNWVDVVERCPAERVCETCVLWSDCRGRAKQASGFMQIDDLIRQWHRTSADTWTAEMACHRPKRRDSVYPNFSVSRHVVEPTDDEPTLAVGGMDFGLRSPTVMLWARVVGEGESAVVHVVDEYIETGRTLSEHLAAIEQQTKAAAGARPVWLGVDPAGRQRNSHTGLTDVALLKREGYGVRTMRSTIREGIERIRRRLDRNTLRIAPRCVRLIEAMQAYHFDADRLANNEPVKDGPDHACDALRYMIINLERGSGAVAVRQWA